MKTQINMKNRNQKARKVLLASALTATLALPGLVGCSAEVKTEEGVHQASAAKGLTPLVLKLPTATAKGTPDDLPKGPNVEQYTDKAPPPFLAPKGIVNVALGKKVSCSQEKLFTGTLSQITDGKKEPDDDQVVEMKKGVQWVQVDLEKAYPIYAIALWHDHRWLQVFHGVVVQAADDAEFTKNIRTVFNNDFEN